MRLHGCVASVALVLALFHPAAAHSPGVLLTLTEPDLGEWLFIGGGTVSVRVAPGDELEFSWTGEFEIPDGATIVGYRYGWDLTDFQYDPDDPGWANPGLQDVNLAPPQSFGSGMHNFAVYVEDDRGRSTMGMVLITVDEALPAEEASVGRLKAGWGD